MTLEDRSWITIQWGECQRSEIGVHCQRPHGRQTRKGLVKPENSCTISLTESELNLLVSGLVVFEREQLRLANLAQEEESTLEAEARRLNASKIKRIRLTNYTVDGLVSAPGF